MGGMGRTINGSYAEYTRPPATNVAQIEANLPWEDLAALPESYATAWTCLFRNLVIASGDMLQASTQVVGLFIDGKPLPPTSKHTRLYERYRERLKEVKAGTAPLGTK